MLSHIVFAIQALLNLWGFSVTRDGIIGSQTAGVLASIRNQSLRNGVDHWNKLIGALGVREEEIVVSYERMISNIDTICGKDVVAASALKYAMDLEAQFTNGLHFIDNEGKHRGVFQFDLETWHLVKGDFATDNRCDPWESTVAAYELYLQNKDYHEAMHPLVTYSSEVAYLYHNQGAPGFSAFLKSGQLRYPKQSDRVVKMATQLWSNIISV